MRVLYIGKHGNGKNDDEGSILYSLEQLGHTVTRITEVQGKFGKYDNNHDLCLFNHWGDYEAIKKIQIPKVFWYFDLVNAVDKTVARRSRNRIEHMRNIIPLVDLGFCTDGDWVNQDKSGKLIRLTQGADPRKIGVGTQTINNKHKILFTGSSYRAGKDRQKFVWDMRNKYRHHFVHIEGNSESNSYGRDLADKVANSHIVVCPNTPVTDNYWSNRVYNALGFGAFVLHPYCKTLKEQYHDGTDLVMYHSMEDLHNKIEEYISDTYKMSLIGLLGLETTKKEHTYLHRCETLINTVKERLGI
ncbi:glycosyltransferase [bacterium]|nr:glycosyltransferase [bacterium]